MASNETADDVVRIRTARAYFFPRQHNKRHGTLIARKKRFTNIHLYVPVFESWRIIRFPINKHWKIDPLSPFLLLPANKWFSTTKNNKKYRNRNILNAKTYETQTQTCANHQRMHAPIIASILACLLAILVEFGGP